MSNGEPRQMTRSTRGAAPRRAAFTLLETMLVLAVMVAVGAMLWPALQKPFAAQRLRKSADQLHADLTRARASAMRSGGVRQFTADPAAATTTTGATYSIGPAVDPAYAAATIEPVVAAGSNVDGGVRTTTLPEGITLVAVEALDDVAPPPYAASPQAAQSEAAPTTASPNAGPSAANATFSTVFFHPDGTTSSARFTLANEQGLYLRVELRGLTGAVTKSDVVSAEQLP